MLRAVLFDFNGVLVDDEPLHFELFRRVLAEEGLELTSEAYYSDYLGFDDRGAFQAFLRASGEPADLGRVMRLIARKAAYYQESVRDQGYPFFPGATALVESCHAAGLMLGVVSGALREEVIGALRQVSLEGYFKIFVAAEDVRASKPDPEGYRLGVEGLNTRPPLPDRLIHPHEVLAIEDSRAGLEAAQGAGLRTLAVTHSYPEEDLVLADAVVPKVADITLPHLEALFN